MRRPAPRRFITLVLTLTGLVAAVACSGGDEDARTAPPTSSGPPTTAGPTGGPLTGLPIDPARAGRPVLIVKVDNAPKARPQAGINEADVVVEEAVEGGVTRFATLFHSREAATVGPVRSARSTDIILAAALNRPLFAYSGANAGFEKLIARSAVVDVGVDRFPNDYSRQGRRSAPYNQFSVTSRLYAHAPPGSGPPPRLFAFRAAGEPASAAGASPATGVSVQFRGVIVTSAQYRWDPASGTWRRSQDGAPHLDAAGVQVAPSNVVVQLVNYHDTGFREQSGAEVPEADLVGEGEAWVLTDGKVVRGQWKKPTPEAVTQYLDSSGSPVRLTPGQTWVELPRPGTAALQP